VVTWYRPVRPPKFASAGIPNNRYENRSWSLWIFYFFLVFSPLEEAPNEHSQSTMDEDGEDGVSFFALRLFWITFPPLPPLFTGSPTGALWLGDLLSLPAQVTLVVFFNIGPVTPFTEYGLFDSVRKPRTNPRIFKFPDSNIAKNCVFTFFCPQLQFVLILISKDDVDMGRKWFFWTKTHLLSKTQPKTG